MEGEVFALFARGGRVDGARGGDDDGGVGDDEEEAIEEPAFGGSEGGLEVEEGDVSIFEDIVE